MAAVSKLLNGISASTDESVCLAEYTGKGGTNPDREAEVRIVSAIIYRFAYGQTMEQSKAAAESITDAARHELINAYSGGRTNRRHKPGRAFENVDYTLDLLGRVGIYRDIQRHRIGTQERQLFTIDAGYNSRKEYEEIGILDDYKSKMQRVTDLYNAIRESMPYQAQYVVTFGFNTRWYYKLNARQLYHLCELRTSPSGHPDYRKLVQDVYSRVRDVHPSVVSNLNFINMDETKLGRLNSEIRIAQKKNRLS